MKKIAVLAFIFTACLCCGKKASAEQNFYFTKNSNNVLTINKKGEMLASNLVDENGNIYVSPNVKWMNRVAEIHLNKYYVPDAEAENVKNNKVVVDDCNLFSKKAHFKFIGGKTSKESINNEILFNKIDALYNATFSLGYGIEKTANSKIILKNVKLLGKVGSEPGYTTNKLAKNNLLQISGVEDGFHLTNKDYFGNVGDLSLNLVTFYKYTDDKNQGEDNKILLENVAKIDGNLTGITVVTANQEEGDFRRNKLVIQGIQNGADIETSKGIFSVKADGGVATSNEVSLDNTKIKGSVIVAYAAKGHKNVMKLSGHSDFSETYLVGAVNELAFPNGSWNSYQFGRFKLDDSNRKDFSGNALHLGKYDDKIETWYGSKVRGLEGFQEIHFHKLDWNPDKPSLAIIEKSDLSNTSFNTTDISFKSKEGLKEALKAGAKMTLIDTGKEDMGINAKNIVTDGTFKVGTAFEGKGDTLVEGNNLVYKIVTEGTGELPAPEKEEVVDVEPILPVREQTHNVMIGNVSGIAAIVAGQDYIESGVSNNLDQNKFGLTTSIATSGANTKYETGSNVETDVWNASFGVGNTVKTKNGALAYMAFYEYGKGDYKVSSEVGSGKGDISYTGLALASKYQWDNNFYAAGSFRIGEMKNDAKDVLADQDKNTYSYNTEGLYTGLSVTIGKKIIFSPNTSLDIYGRFAHTSIEKDEFKVNGERYNLDAVSSDVLSLRSKMQHNLDAWQVYYGLAVEQELSGEAKGTVDGAEIKSADISGTSFIGEIGAKLKVSDDSPWTLDLGVQGSTGKHTEVRGNFGVTYTF